MAVWAEKPFVYQINTWVWLDTLSRRFGQKITLANVPDAVLDEIARPGLDMIWLMGVWKRSAWGRENALNYKHEYKARCPDLTDDDVIGSAYAIGDYVVDERIGGRAALAALRQRLKARGLALMLDFVPNHVGVDHPWVTQHPEYFIQGKPEDLKNRPVDFFRLKTAAGKSLIFAHGRDPMFPGWSDTAQLNAFNPKLRQAAAKTLQRHCQPMRRRALRYGDAAAEQHLRRDVERLRWRAAGNRLLARDHPAGEGETPALHVRRRSLLG